MGRRTCDQALAKVYHYLDGEITWLRRLAIRRHLKACPPCGSAFQFEERLQVVVREKSQEEVPPELINRLRSIIEDEPQG